MTAGTVIAASLGVAAVLEDLRRRQLPNWLAAAAVAGGLACAAWGRPHGLGLATAGAIVGFLIPLPFHRYGTMGGGDVKLMAAYGALLGPSGILLAAVFATVIGGLSAAGKLLLNPRTLAIPYVAAIVLGAWVSLLGGGL
jgi:prepilin peptidase CpaA